MSPLSFLLIISSHKLSIMFINILHFKYCYLEVVKFINCINDLQAPRYKYEKKNSLRLSFRTSEESLRNAFQNFGQLVEVNLVMDKIANRSRGFAFIRYATEEESQNAIDGMHGKFLDGRVIFVEVAKSRSEMRSLKQSQ
ncbi:hypothetical protein K2173_027155 [Erythroxylum novogranatense]|uniref:RRM domain-containing protein n=1 Tax=Erythroxylum novogranatense TaxID=1862640 RepID=A0AAV8U251_9ROSI|nr:hypothetical protein K2173_027155 [Erythroxylum novogranatense]